MGSWMRSGSAKVVGIDLLAPLMLARRIDWYASVPAAVWPAAAIMERS
ncbi:MAG TPA: hypothetical protein VGI53_08640 [Dyella sp.]|jgi:hypothetical protein